MRKNFKRWLAFLLAVVVVATTCIYAPDHFLHATDGETEGAVEEEEPEVEEQELVVGGESEEEPEGEGSQEQDTTSQPDGESKPEETVEGTISEEPDSEETTPETSEEGTEQDSEEVKEEEDTTEDPSEEETETPVNENNTQEDTVAPVSETEDVQPDLSVSAPRMSANKKNQEKETCSVYVYVQFTGIPENVDKKIIDAFIKEKFGTIELNDSSWYTIGEITKVEIKGPEKDSTYPSKEILEMMGRIERYEANGGIGLSSVVWDENLISSYGANNYPNTPLFTWHLNGRLDLSKDFNQYKTDICTGTVELDSWIYGDTASVERASIKSKIDGVEANYKAPVYSYRKAETNDEFSSKKPTEVGEYEVKAVWESINSDYPTVKASDTFEITKRKVTVSVEKKVTYNGNLQEFKVDGTYLSSDEKVDGLLEGHKLNLNNAEISGIDAEVYEIKTYSWEIRKDSSEVSSNYEVILNAKLIINKREVTIFEEEVKAYNGFEQELNMTGKSFTNLDIKDIIPGHTIQLKNGIISGTNAGVYTQFDDDISNPTYIVISEEKNVTHNYDVKITGKLTITQAPKDYFFGNVIMEDWTYGDKSSEPTAYLIKGEPISDHNKTPRFVYKKDNDNEYKDEKPEDAGSYTVKAIWDATDNCAEIEEETKFIIHKREITIYAEDTKPYINTEQRFDITQATENIRYDGLVDEDTFIEIRGIGISGTEVGIYEKITGNASYKIVKKSASNKDVTDNYIINVTGKFIIVNSLENQYTASVVLDDWIYGDEAEQVNASIEGTGHDYGRPTYTYKKQGEDDSTYTTEKPKNAGDYVVRAIWAETDNCQQIIKTDNFTIKRRPVVFTAATKEKSYDGIALTTDESTIDNIVKGHSYTATVTGSQTLVGSSESKVIATSIVIKDADGNSVTSNYNIRTVPGTLTVTPPNKDNSKLIVTKKVLEPDRVYGLGDTVIFEIWVKNVYGGTDSKDITLTEIPGVEFIDSTPDEVESNTLAKFLTGLRSLFNSENSELPVKVIKNVAPNEEVTVRAKHKITEEDIVAGKFTNTVTAELENNIYEASASVESILHNKHITVTKEIVNSNPDKKYALGEEVEYKIVVTNDGNMVLNNIVVEDELTGNTEENGNAFIIKELDINESKEFTVYYTITEEDIRKGEVVNVATAKGAGTDPDEEKPEVTPGKEIIQTESPLPLLTLTKTTPEADAERIYKLGDTITYHIVAKNEGNVDLTDIRVEDELTGNVGDQGTFVIDRLKPGESSDVMVVTYTVTDMDVLTGNGIITNIATATCNAGITDPDNPDKQTVLTFESNKKEDPIEKPGANLSIIKTADKTTNVKPGDEITYTITVINNGMVTLKDIDIVDELTGDMWRIVELAPKKFWHDTVTYTVTEADLLKGSVTNIVTASGTDQDGNAIAPEDGTAVTQTERINTDYTVTKRILNPQSKYIVDDSDTPIRYEIAVTSQANVTLHNVVVKDQLEGASGQVTFTELGKGTLNADNSVTIPELAPGETVTLNCEYIVRRADAGKNLVNTAIAAADPVVPTDSQNPTPVTPDEKRSSAAPASAEDIYTLTIHYRYASGREAAPDVVAQYLEGESFFHRSPSISGYKPNHAFIRSGNQGMPARDVEVTVTYRANASGSSSSGTTTTDPTPNPGPGAAPGVTPDNTTPAAGGTTAPAAGTAPASADGVAVPDDGVPMGAMVQLDEDGSVDIIPVADENVPLSAREFSKHMCCVLHLILTLASMIILASYTSRRKRCQARIFELTEQLRDAENRRG